MQEPVRWTSHVVFEWTPILTFTRRRLALLDWFEENVDVHAFTDDPDHVGIAVGTPFQRLRFDRVRLSLSMRHPEAAVRPLAFPLEGLWNIIEPENVTLARYFAAWSRPLEASYDDARSRFADRAVGLKPSNAGIAFDAACLVDIATPSGMYKFEFGVVSDAELQERLSATEIGMLGTSAEDRPTVDTPVDALPDASVFFDVVGYFNSRQRSAAKLVSQFEQLESEVSRLAAEIGSAI